MGSVHCTQIPFILIMTNQSHHSSLLTPYSADSQEYLKTHIGTGIVELFFVMILTTPYAYESMFYVQTLSWSQSHLITPSFCNHDISAYCQPHSGSAAYTLPIVIYFQLTGPCIALPLTLWYIIRIGCMDHFLSFNTVGYSSPLLPCRSVDLRRGLIYSENLQQPPLALFPLPILLQTALLQPTCLFIAWSTHQGQHLVWGTPTLRLSLNLWLVSWNLLGLQTCPSVSPRDSSYRKPPQALGTDIVYPPQSNALSAKSILGGRVALTMIKCGKYFPRHPPLPGDHLGRPTTYIWSIYFGQLT